MLSNRLPLLAKPATACALLISPTSFATGAIAPIPTTESVNHNAVEKARVIIDYFFAAAKLGETDILKGYLDVGFPVDARNSGSYTALMMAADHGQQDAVNLLLEHNANRCLRDKRNDGGYGQSRMAYRQKSVSTQLR